MNTLLSKIKSDIFDIFGEIKVEELIANRPLVDLLKDIDGILSGIYISDLY